jgi:hypothetical protein
VIAFRLFRWDWSFTLERDIYCVSVTAGPCSCRSAIEATSDRTLLKLNALGEVHG